MLRLCTKNISADAQDDDAGGDAEQQLAPAACHPTAAQDGRDQRDEQARDPEPPREARRKRCLGGSRRQMSRPVRIGLSEFGGTQVRCDEEAVVR